MSGARDRKSRKKIQSTVTSRSNDTERTLSEDRGGKSMTRNQTTSTSGSEERETSVSGEIAMKGGMNC